MTNTQALASKTLELAKALIQRESVTPADGGCCELLASRLRPLGFETELLNYHDVTNLWAVREGGRPGPTVVLAGHVDVVPPGPTEKWLHAPFSATLHDGYLYGRGAADMKSSVAAFATATEAFIQQTPSFHGRIAYLITSDEEGPALHGTVEVLRELAHRGEPLNYCIIGEPTSSHKLGDIIKNGRRGTLSGKLYIRGKQGHVAYPHLAENPIHRFAPALTELAAIRWDDGNTYFPATTWQVSNIHSGTGAGNVIPGELVADFNFRFGSVSTPDALKQRLESVLNRHGLSFTIDWNLGGDPYLTPTGTLCDIVQESIRSVCKIEPQLSTTGGTSDGRFIAKHCREVIEFGPINASIHQINERILATDLLPLAQIYLESLTRLLASSSSPVVQAASS